MAFDPIIAEQINSTESSYNDAIKRNIKFNAMKGRYKRFLEDASDDFHNAYIVAKLDEYFNQIGRPEMSEEIYYMNQDMPEVRAVYKEQKDWDFKNPSNSFLSAMWDNLQEWGSLTEKQIAAVEKVLAGRDEFLINREKKMKEAAENSSHVGVVGERQTFTAKVDKIISGEGNFGYWHITRMTCEETGQQLVYKNTINIKETYDEENHTVYHFVAEGDVVKFDAKIKEHSDFNGVKQTVLQRATKTSIVNKGENNV
jgi:hypothetical protein